MSGGLAALIFVMLIVVIIFLGLQVNDNAHRYKETKLSHQNRVTKAGRLLIQSATQSHPIFAHEHALEAKIIIDEVIQEHGGMMMAERNLKLPKGKLENLRSKIYAQYQDIQSHVMENLIARQPDLDIEENEDAGLVKPKRHHRHHSQRRKKHRS